MGATIAEPAALGAMVLIPASPVGAQLAAGSTRMARRTPPVDVGGCTLQELLNRCGRSCPPTSRSALPIWKIRSGMVQRSVRRRPGSARGPVRQRCAVTTSSNAQLAQAAPGTPINPCVRPPRWMCARSHRSVAIEPLPLRLHHVLEAQPALVEVQVGVSRPTVPLLENVHLGGTFHVARRVVQLLAIQPQHRVSQLPQRA